MDTLKGRWMLDPWVWQRGEEMSLKKLSLVLAAFLLIGLFLVITASHYIGLLRGEAIVVRGTLQGVSWDGIGRRGRDYGLELYVNGDVYNICLLYTSDDGSGLLAGGLFALLSVERLEHLGHMLDLGTGHDRKHVPVKVYRTALVFRVRKDLAHSLQHPLAPVSYTHLDVYKRQAWGRPTALPAWRRADRKAARLFPKR